MYVRVISFGTNWWAMRSADTNDPLRFKRRAAYFNAAALMSGRRLRHSAVYRGQIRFNSNSGFDPEFPSRSIGKTFDCSGPNRVDGKSHLLFGRPAPNVKPDAYLTTLNFADHGQIVFDHPGWRSPGVRPISISLRWPRYEAMVLMEQNDWVQSEIGCWGICTAGCRLVLLDAERGAIG